MVQQLRIPKQQRSQQTLDRILSSAEELFRTGTTVDVSVREICEAAHASPSSFYARFPERSALHHLLFDRFAKRVSGLFDDVADSCSPALPLHDFAYLLLDRFTGFWQAESGLIRALQGEESVDPTLRAKRQFLDREILRRSLRLLGDFYGDKVDIQATVARVHDALPAIAAAYRGAADPPDQLGLDAPDARERLVRYLADLCLLVLVMHEPEEVQ